MIHRVTVFSKMKDVAIAEMEKRFDVFVCYSIDKYSNGMKGIGYVFEVDGMGDEKIGEVNKAAEGIARAVNSPVLIQRYESTSRILQPNETAQER